MLPVNVVRQAQSRAVESGRQTRVLIGDRPIGVESRGCNGAREVLRLPADSLGQTGSKKHRRGNIIIRRASKSIDALLPAILQGEVAWASPIMTDSVGADGSADQPRRADKGRRRGKRVMNVLIADPRERGDLRLNPILKVVECAELRVLARHARVVIRGVERQPRQGPAEILPGCGDEGTFVKSGVSKGGRGSQRGGHNRRRISPKICRVKGIAQLAVDQTVVRLPQEGGKGSGVNLRLVIRRDLREIAKAKAG